MENSPLTQADFNQMFTELITNVNKDYNFNLKHRVNMERCCFNDLAYFIVSINEIILFHCGLLESYRKLTLKTTFIADTAAADLTVATANLERDLRKALDEINEAVKWEMSNY